MEQLTAKVSQPQNGATTPIQNNKAQIEAELEAWKALKLNVGVLGPSNELKTLLINKMIGVEAAPTGTDEAKAYIHPNNMNLVIWDLNTSKPDKMAKKDVDKYDLLILFRDKPVKEDTEFVNEMEKSGKKCLIVTFDCSAKFDLSKLHLDIMRALMLLTKDHLALYGLSIRPPSSAEIIDAKKNILGSRIEKVAMLSSMFGHLFNLTRFNIICKICFLNEANTFISQNNTVNCNFIHIKFAFLLIS